MLHLKKRKIKKIIKYSLLSLCILIALGLAVTLGIYIYKECTKPVRTYTDEEMFLGSGLSIVETGKYSGKYFEDGTDEEVNDVMFIVLKNNSSKDLQYADIVALSGDTEFLFTASNIPSGASVMLLEKGKQQAKKELTSAEAESVSFFGQNMDIKKSLFKIQRLEGVINLINISGSDITDDVYLYYKNGGDGLYFGGITYRARVTGGIKANEVKQLGAKHFSSADSDIVDIVLTASAE